VLAAEQALHQERIAYVRGVTSARCAKLDQTSTNTDARVVIASSA